ncbi:carboxylesterase [Agromyces sp. Leaf222]|nr:carboxylesterase [Agromyces sp. Leaf222]
MFHDLQRNAGGVGRFLHNREPASVEEQAVIRMNRDTLYSFAVVDATAGATLTLPEHGDRYLSAMVVNEDHYIDAVFHDPGDYEITAERFGTPYVVVAVRTLVDPADPTDIAAVAAIQDAISLATGADATPFESPEYDTASLDETRDALLALARNLTGFDRTFGAKHEVDPVRHLIGTAAGWGGLPSSEASYLGVDPRLPVGTYELTVADVPVDGFWSISVYNAKGFFEPNERGAYTVNNITGVRNADGSTTVRFGDYPADVPNAIPIAEGWNYLVRLYRPRAEIADGSWSFPTLSA